jgi:beta-barrel assembly-enhancing protease
VLLLQAESLLARGAAPRAMQVLQPFVAENARPVVLAMAQITLAPSFSADATVLTARAADLQTWVALNPNDAIAWSDLAQVWSRLGQPLRALRAEAESRAGLGDLTGAVDRLRAGQRVARGGGPVDFIDVSVIDARLRDIEAQRKAIAADERAQR